MQEWVSQRDHMAYSMFEFSTRVTGWVCAPSFLHSLQAYAQPSCMSAAADHIIIQETDPLQGAFL